MDMHLPQYPLSAAAEVCGIDLKALRAHFETGRFLFLDGVDQPPWKRGATRLLSFQTVINVAVACALINIGIGPREAFLAGINFTDSNTNKLSNSYNIDRGCGELYPEKFMTLLVVRGGGDVMVMPIVPGDPNSFDCIFDGSAGRRLRSVAILNMNDLIAQLQEGLEGASRPPSLAARASGNAAG